MRSKPLTDRHICIWPTPLPDETLFSTATQHHLLSAGTLATQTLERLFGCHSIFLAGGFPTHLRALSNHLKFTAPAWTEERLIQQFTFLPYIRFFYDESIVEQVKGLVLRQNGRSIKTLLGWVASRLGASEPLRCCPACYTDDHKTYGRPYWHRAHQLPGVLACHIHLINLVHIPGPAEGYGRFSLFPPPAAVRSAPLTPANSFWVRCADWSKEFLHNPPTPIGAKKLKELYIDRLRQLGFITKNGCVRQRDFQSWILQHLWKINDPELDQIDNLVCGIENLEWATKIVRKPRNTQHPLKHIILLMLLFETVNEFRSTLPLYKEQSNKNDEPDKEKTSTLINMKEETYRSLHELSTTTGQSVTTLVVELKRQDMRIKKRPKVLTDTLLRTIKAAIKNGVAMKTIGEEFGVSPASIYRILRIYPKISEQRRNLLQRLELHHRRMVIHEWLAANLNGTLRELIAQHNADVTWLRRHDNLWLQKMLQRCKVKIRQSVSCVDWSSRDLQLLSLLREAYDRLLTMNGKPCRITRTALAREVDAVSWVHKHRENIPLCDEFLKSHVDSNSSFHGRRLTWAVQELASKQLAINPSTVVRLAGIRWPAPSILDNALALSQMNELCVSALK